MKATEMLNQVKNLLGVELSDIKLAELKLENGTVLEAESFEAGKEVFILTEDEKVALPVGEYELEDSRVLVVQEEGVIQEIKAQEEEEVIEDDSEEVEAEYISREEFTKEIDEIKAMIEKLGNKEDMSSQVAEQVSLAVTEVLNEEAKEEEILAEELSKPAADPIKHSPEEDKFEAKFKFAQNRKKSTLDRVMETIVNK
jgi:hypothetical protein|tara:strand:- start:1267 stop:1863 length:597 start_codon:yes stop_codon:yes gene_type:complete